VYVRPEGVFLHGFSAILAHVENINNSENFEEENNKIRETIFMTYGQFQQLFYEQLLRPYTSNKDYKAKLLVEKKLQKTLLYKKAARKTDETLERSF